MLFDFSAVLIFIAVSIAFVFGNLYIVGWLLRPKVPTAEKLLVYECGEPAIGSTWIRYNIRFYTVALVYLIFDVEVVVLFPAMLILRQVGVLALFAVMIFVLVLILGLAYEWRYGNLEWIKSDFTPPEDPEWDEPVSEEASEDQAGLQEASAGV